MKHFLLPGIAAALFVATPATAQSINASVEYLEMKPGGSTTLYPWFAMRAGGTFTLMLIKGRGIINATAARVKKQAGHCYAENVHQVSVRSPALMKQARPHRDLRGNKIWPEAIMIAPAAPNARFMKLSRLGAPDLPKGQNKVNLVAAVDVNGNGFADIVLLKTCSGYDMKQKKTQAQLDAMDHRQCPKKVPVFQQLYLRSKGAWKQVWYRDLC